MSDLSSRFDLSDVGALELDDCQALELDDLEPITDEEARSIEGAR